MAISSVSAALIQLSEQNTHQNVTSDLPLLPSTYTEPTASQEWGPYYVRNAPFRAKICPVDAPGVPLVISGRIFGLDTRRPLPFATLDVWHAYSDGTYDYHETDPNAEIRNVKELNTHGLSSHFDNRARLITDEQGQYEFETVKPPPYYVPYSFRWRCPHIHYYLQAVGYKPVLTQLYFKGEERNDTDIQIQESITIELKTVERERNDGSKFRYSKGEFDIVMAPSTSD